MWTDTGSMPYRAPETFEGAYGVQADVWSTGIIAFELLTGKLPFHEELQEETKQAILTQSINIFDLKIEFLAKTFLENILIKNPEVRLSAKEALDTPFLTHWSMISSVDSFKSNSTVDDNSS